MRLNDNNKEQKRKIMEFDSELFTYTGVVAWFLPGLFSFCAIGLGCVPYSCYEKGESVPYFLIYLTAMISYFVLMPYQWTCDSQHRNADDNTYKILRYMPVTIRNYIVVRMKYVFRYFWKLTALMTGIQIIISIVSKSFAIENYLYVILCFIIIPMVTAAIEMFVTTLNK